MRLPSHVCTAFIHQPQIKSYIQRTLSSSWESEVDSVVRPVGSMMMHGTTSMFRSAVRRPGLAFFSSLSPHITSPLLPLFQISSALLRDQEVCTPLQTTLELAASQPMAIEPDTMMQLVTQLYRIRPRLLAATPQLEHRFLASVGRNTPCPPAPPPT